MYKLDEWYYFCLKFQLLCKFTASTQIFEVLVFTSSYILHREREERDFDNVTREAIFLYRLLLIWQNTETYSDDLLSSYILRFRDQRFSFLCSDTFYFYLHPAGATPYITRRADCKLLPNIGGNISYSSEFINIWKVVTSWLIGSFFHVNWGVECWCFSIEVLLEIFSIVFDVYLRIHSVNTCNLSII